MNPNLSTSRNILVVDDEPEIRRLIHRVLSHLNPAARVDEASNGLEAVERLHSQPAPDILIIDLRLPIIGGLEICSMVREEKLPMEKIMAMTGYPSPEATNVLTSCGVETLLLKPFDVQELEFNLRKIFSELFMEG